MIDHFTLVGLVFWPLNESKAVVDIVLIETSLLFLCKFLLNSMRTTFKMVYYPLQLDHGILEFLVLFSDKNVVALLIGYVF